MVEANLRYKTLTDLSRILSLFETQEMEERGVSDISKSLKMLPSKVSRMLKTLEIEGFVEKNRHTGKFRIGARFLQLGLLYVLNHPLRRIILPHLEQVARDLGLLSAWGIFKNGRTIVVDRFRLDNRPSIYLLGSEVPLHSSSYGKLFLAYLTEEEQKRVLKSLVFAKLAPATIDNLKSMMVELTKMKNKGYAVDDGETREGLVGLSAPVFDEAGGLAAALTVSGNVADFSKDRVTEISYLREKALFISRQLGYRARGVFSAL